MISSLLRLIWPLRLRHRVYFLLHRLGWMPSRANGAVPLALARVSLTDLLPSDHTHQQIMATGSYDLKLSARIARLAREGGLMIDAGANVGYFSALWAASNPKNTVIAFEPSPRNVAMLRSNMKSAGLDDRVSVVPHALGRQSASFDFDPGPNHHTGWGGLTSASTSETLKVQVNRLDEVLEPEARIKALKIDCEGADPWIIEGAGRLLRQHRIEHVFFEVNPVRQKRLGVDPAVAMDLLAECGYDTRPLAKDSLEFHATFKPEGRK